MTYLILALVGLVVYTVSAVMSLRYAPKAYCFAYGTGRTKVEQVADPGAMLALALLPILNTGYAIFSTHRYFSHKDWYDRAAVLHKTQGDDSVEYIQSLIDKRRADRIKELERLINH